MKNGEILANSQVQRRRQLHEILCNLIDSRNVYFNPPSDLLIKYPAIVYNLSPEYTRKADDKRYMFCGHYSLTYIDKNVESCIAMKQKFLDSFNYISIERSFTSENLNHDVYNLYY